MTLSLFFLFILFSVSCSDSPITFDIPSFSPIGSPVSPVPLVPHNIVHGTAGPDSFFSDENNYLVVHVNTTTKNFSSTPTYFSWAVSDCDIIFSCVSVLWNVSQFGFDIYPYDGFSGNRVNVSSVLYCNFQIRWIAFKDGETIPGFIYGSAVHQLIPYNNTVFYGAYTTVPITSFVQNPSIFTSIAILGNTPIQPYYGVNSIYSPTLNSFTIYLANFTKIPEIQINWLTAHPSCVFNVSSQQYDNSTIFYPLPSPNVFTTLYGYTRQWQTTGTTSIRSSSEIFIIFYFQTNDLLTLAQTSEWVIQYLDFSKCNNSLAIDCQSTWSPWSICISLDTPCKNSTQRRNMTMIPAAYGGIPCNQSTDYQERMCTVKGCPVDCVWGSWGSWSGCPLCGVNVSESRSRNITQSGISCNQSTDYQERMCTVEGCPVDCVWGSWGSWSGCPLCGVNMSESRSRNITQMEIYGGTCLGNHTDSVPCNILPCSPCATIPPGFICINGTLKESLNTTLIDCHGNYGTLFTCYNGRWTSSSSDVILSGTIILHGIFDLSSLFVNGNVLVSESSINIKNNLYIQKNSVLTLQNCSLFVNGDLYFNPQSTVVLDANYNFTLHIKNCSFLDGSLIINIHQSQTGKSLPILTSQSINGTFFSVIVNFTDSPQCNVITPYLQYVHDLLSVNFDLVNHCNSEVQSWIYIIIGITGLLFFIVIVGVAYLSWRHIEKKDKELNQITKKVATNRVLVAK